MHDQKGKIIYVGKAVNIKNRIAGHFNSRADKLPFFTSIANITYQECGTELIALLLEASEIKKNFPPFNKAQKISNHVYILTTYTDTKGIHRLLVSRNHKVLKPLMTFRGFDQARAMLNQIREQFELCPRFCGIHQVNGACYDFADNKCKGACSDAEAVDSYNERAMLAMDYLKNVSSSKLIIDKGRSTGEKSVVVIDQGIYKGFGYFDESVSINSVEDALEHIQLQKHTADIEHILAAYN
jgi:DNA polymerase-3 subunit epsilon